LQRLGKKLQPFLLAEALEAGTSHLYCVGSAILRVKAIGTLHVLHFPLHRDGANLNTPTGLLQLRCLKLPTALLILTFQNQRKARSDEEVVGFLGHPRCLAKSLVCHGHRLTGRQAML